jgi:lipopolysaccharide transport system ATP-binding protein
MPISDIAVSVRGLSKSYTIAHNYEKPTTLIDAAIAKLRNPLRGPEKETFWALKDVSFDIRKGDVIGIIGRNGAGKSTMLKVLSRITEPTTGEIHVFGRVGSLLEVGTGFHPELTGRENVFLNGAILGMSKPEIRKQFDAIVDFAGVEKFLDTPVKRYSSGMYVRLAFAVAAHLRSEILIVDEVLAVGDASFQKKCLGKMEEVGKTGRTVVFVSHNMLTMMRLCAKMMLMEKGRLKAMGNSQAVAEEYMREGRESTAVRTWDASTAPGDEIAALKSVRAVNAAGQTPEHFDIRQPVFIEVEYWNRKGGPLKPTVAIHIINSDGTTLFATNDFNDTAWRDSDRSVGVVRSVCTIPGNFLAEGRFYVLAAVVTYNPDTIHAFVDDAIAFDVSELSLGDGVRGEATSAWPGVIRPYMEWKVQAS